MAEENRHGNADSLRDEEQNVAKENEDEELVAKNIFKTQWEDSDVVFVVEKTKFHVHRALLSLMSPVFRVMFNSNFREKEQQEIPLPGKKVNVFLSFLLIVYSKEAFNEITMSNVCDLLELGDEYQVERVKKDCQKFLMMTNTADSQMVLKVLLVTQNQELDSNFRTWCCKELASTKVDNLTQLEGFENLNVTSLKSILLPQLKEYQACLKDVFAQLIALLDFTVYLLTNARRSGFMPCQEHYSSGRATIGSERGLRECTVCQTMFKRLHEHAPSQGTMFGSATISNNGAGEQFDNNIVKVAWKVMEMLGTL